MPSVEAAAVNELSPVCGRLIPGWSIPILGGKERGREGWREVRCLKEEDEGRSKRGKPLLQEGKEEGGGRDGGGGGQKRRGKGKRGR